MTRMNRVCLVGQVFVDVDLRAETDPLTRLGGVFHAVRALHGTGAPYATAFVAPEYLDGYAKAVLAAHGCRRSAKVGTVTGCPNIWVVRSAKETADQGYFAPLWSYQKATFDPRCLKRLLREFAAESVLVFPGGIDFAGILGVLARHDAGVHIDLGNAVDDIKNLRALKRPAQCISASTSSLVFLRECRGSAKRLCDLLFPHADSILLKENRGGSRFFLKQGRAIETLAVPAHPARTKHSVGVGDCFNAVFAALHGRMDDQTSLGYASLIAGEYAATYDTEIFASACRAALRLPGHDARVIQGVSISWERRSRISVYVAAPDFRGTDRRDIDEVVTCLRYHNFRPRLPVREHGEVPVSASLRRKQAAFDADVRLLGACRAVIAVLPFDDPGTLVEIGIAYQMGIPVLVYDPYERVSNLMVSQLAEVVTSDLDVLLNEFFRIMSSRMAK